LPLPWLSWVKWQSTQCDRVGVGEVELTVVLKRR
jgi:hypothetical protein